MTLEQMIREHGVVAILTALMRHTSAQRVLVSMALALKARSREIVPLNDVSAQEEALCLRAAEQLQALFPQVQPLTPRERR